MYQGFLIDTVFCLMSWPWLLFGPGERRIPGRAGKGCLPARDEVVVLVVGGSRRYLLLGRWGWLAARACTCSC